MGLFFGHNQMSGVDNDFVFTIDTTKGTGDSFTLPLRSTFTYNFVVDWGDGDSSEITAYNDPDITHNYSAGGVYQLRISGTCEAWFFNNAGDKLKITSVDNWGNTSIANTGFYAAFFGCVNLTSIPDLIPYSNLTTIQYFLQTCSSITVLPNNLVKNLINCTSFAQSFSGTSISIVPIDFFKTCTNAIAFSLTFQNCILLRNLPENLFYYCLKATNYLRTFQSNRNLILPSVLFNLSNLSIVTTFANFMDVASTAYSPTGTIQDIWNYTTATSTDAFDQCTAITNYADIPTAWT